MTWTYGTDLETPRDRVRFVIGDTDNDRQLLTDEEIEAILVIQNNDITRTAIALAEHLEAKFVRRAESRSGDIIADFLTVAGKYAALAKRLRKRGLKGYSLVDAAARDADKADTTFPGTNLSLGEFDNPGAT
jgi:hypothetical protein